MSSVKIEKNRLSLGKNRKNFTGFAVKTDFHVCSILPLYEAQRYGTLLPVFRRF